MPLLGGSQREARETAQRLSRPVAHRESGFPVPGLSGLHPRQFAGVAPQAIRARGSSLSLVLIEPLTHVRGGVPPLSIRGDCTPGNSRRVAARDKSRPWQLAIARAHRATSARPRRSASAVNSRRVAARDKSRLWQLAIARAHRATSARARRGLCVALPPPLGRGPSAAQKRKLGKQRPQARTFPQGAASQAAGRMRPFFQKSCKKPFTFGALAQYTGG